MPGNFELQDITFKSYLTDGNYFPQLNPHVLDEVYEVGTTAFQAELPNRTPEEIEYVMGGREGLPARLANPAIDAESGRLLPDQSFADPSLTVAFTDADKSSMRIVGYSFSADNASGSPELVRRAKQLTVVKNYRWLRTVAVLPDYQGRGIGSVLSAVTLAKASRFQPASAYTWPTEGDSGTRLVESLGMTRTGRRNRDVYGTGELIGQRRYEAKRARSVVQTVVDRGGPEVERLIQNESLRAVRRKERDTLSFLANHRR